MFMQILKEVQWSPIEKGFEVVLFDNTKGGKDHNVKLARPIDKVFTRFIRGAGYVTLTKITPYGSGEGDVAFSHFHDVPHEATGFKIEDTRITSTGNDDGHRGVVKALIRPFGPRYNELKELIEDSRNRMDFKLNCVVDKHENIYQAVCVGYGSHPENFKL